MFYLISAIVGYSTSNIMQWFSLINRTKLPKRWWLTWSAIGILAYGIYLYKGILINRLNIDLLGLIALTSWLISLLVWLQALNRSEALALWAFPLTMTCMILHQLFGSHTIKSTTQLPTRESLILTHVLISTLTLSVLCLAGLEALMFELKGKQLRLKSIGNIMHLFPPLETMEDQLFKIVKISFGLLTIVLISSIYLFYGLLTEVRVMSKLILTLSTWCLFVCLLVGHYGFGWRGHKVVYGVWIGTGLIAMVYFSLQLVNILSF